MSGVSNTKRVRALIQSAKDEHSLTYAEISRRADHKIGKSLVHKLATELHRDDLLPSDQLRALAQGLGVSFHEVRDAALADLGFLDEDEVDAVDVPAAIRKDTGLLPEARAHLLSQYGLLKRLTAPAADEEELRAAMISDIEAIQQGETGTQDPKRGTRGPGAAKRP